MNDLERIQEIEKIFGFKLNEVPLDKLDSENEFYSISTYNYYLPSLNEATFPYKGTRNYALDDSKNVLGLSLDYSPVLSLKTDFLLNFKNLKHLRLKNVSLLNYSFLQKFENLKYLNISNNSLSNKDIAFLKDMKGLVSLDISNNEILDISFLEGFNELQTLDLSSNNLSNISSLEKLGNLTSLNLRNNNISNVSFLKSLKSISTLDLRSNKFTEASLLGEMKNLTALYLSFNTLSDISFLQKLNELTILYLSELGLTDISFLKELKKLRSLFLGSNTITDYSILDNLSELSSLDLSHTNLEGKNLSFFEQVNSIASLNLSDVNLSDFSFLKELRDINILYLRNNSIADVSFLKKFESRIMKVLDLRNNKISDISPIKKLEELTALDLSLNYKANYSSLKENKKLKLLFLRNNNLSDISFLENLKEITALDLSHNNILDIFPLKKLEKLTSLDLRNNDVLNITPLRNLRQLTSLDLRYNNFSDISSLNTLNGLTILDLSSNDRIRNYSSISSLKGLTFLGLRNNKLSDLSSISGLVGLTSLDLGNNKLENLSNVKELGRLSFLDLTTNKDLLDFSSLLGLTNLISLDLSYSGKKDYSFLRWLTALTSLGLSKNELSDVDISFLKELKNLISLNLKSNQLTDISFISELKYLEFIDLRNNQIKELNVEIIESKLEIIIEKDVSSSSQCIALSGNPIETPPLEFVRQGNECLKDYFDKLREGQEYLNDCKLVIIGREGSGKSTIARVLANNNFALNERIDASGYSSFSEITIPKEKLEIQNDIIILDIGGKDLFHTTHQFFISKRSIYLLVIEAPNELPFDKLHTWLNRINETAGSNPIILIQNKIDKSVKNFNLDDYCKKYPQLYQDMQLISCNTETPDWENKYKEKIGQLWKTIFQIIKEKRTLEFGDKLPIAYVSILREVKELKDKGRNYIEIEEYLKICNKFNLDQRQALHLSKYFHDVGIFLHFQNDIGLTQIIFLNHQWITKAFYRLFEHLGTKRMYGKFTDDDLKAKAVWNEEEYYILLPLLKNPRFKICYQDKNGYYLIPQLFNKEALDINLNSQNNILSYRFEYEILHRGTLARLIASMHENILVNYYWRYGVLFKYNESLAMVTQDRKHNQINIRVEGKSSAELLKNINKEIRNINQTFKKILITEKVGCICSKCQQNLKKQYFFSKELIDKYIEKNMDHIICENSIEVIKIESLGVDIDFAQQEQETRIEKNSNSFMDNIKSIGTLNVTVTGDVSGSLLNAGETNVKI